MQNSIVDIKIEIDSKGAVKKVDVLSNSMDKLDKKTKKAGDTAKSFGDKMNSAAERATVVFGALGATLGKSIVSFSDFNETVNKSQVVFGEFYGEFEAEAKNAHKTLGMSERAYLQMASTYGAMGNSMGLSKEQSKDYAKSLTSLAGDIASFNNLSIDQAETALKGIYTGETESLKTLGYSITENTLKQYGYSSSMSESEKIAIRYKAIMDQTKDAHGDFGRTSESTSNQLKIAKAEFENLFKTIGEQLDPIFNPLIQKFNGFLIEMQTFIKENPEVVKTVLILMGVLGGFIGAIMLVRFGMFLWSGATAMVNGAMLLFKGTMFLVNGVIWLVNGGFAALNATLLANPITWIVIGVMALIVALILLWQNWDFVVEMFKIGVQKVVEFVKAIPGAIMGFIGFVAQSIWNFIKSIGTGIVNLLFALPGIIWNAILKIPELIKNALMIAFNVLKWFAGKAFDMFTMPFKIGMNIISFVMENGKSIVNGFLDFIKFGFKTAVNVITLPFRTLISVINKVIEGINKVQVPDWVPIIGGQGINIPMLPNIPAFAKGTNFAPGGVSLVGEEGPELVNLPRGSQVIPHAKTMAQLNGAKGGNNIYLNFNVDTSNSVVPNDFANSIINSTVNVVENRFGTAFKGVLT